MFHVLFMIDTEILEIDRAERGECHGNGSHREKALRQESGEGTSMRQVSQSFSQTQAAVDDSQGRNIGERWPPSKSPFPADTTYPEEACGPLGLARVKNYDPRFAFYPGFAVERSLALEFRAEGISELSAEIDNLRKDMESFDMGKSPKQPLSESAEKLPILMTRLADSIAQYGRSRTPPQIHRYRG